MGCPQISYNPKLSIAYKNETLKNSSDDKFFIGQKVASSYYPFGMKMSGRTLSVAGDYRYGFNGMEKDDEISGSGNSYDFGARMYDSRIGRWRSVDPLASAMPYISPYAYALNNPIYFLDADGKLPWPVKKWKNAGWKISSSFGMRTLKGKTKMHYGLDINSNLGGDSDLGAPVYSTHQGKIVEVHNYTDSKDGGGSYIKIQSPDGSFQTVYMHLETIDVVEGQVVKEGDQIGTVGGSGFGKKKAYLAHLHYEFRKKVNDEYVSVDPMLGGENGNPIDPQKLIGNQYDYSWMSDENLQSNINILTNRISIIGETAAMRANYFEAIGNKEKAFKVKNKATKKIMKLQAKLKSATSEQESRKSKEENG